ncbi:Cyclin-dependent kinase inhibitor [Thalictrum thalictroides]|uniref:Cyclin-dependent kinase inhibitor n=1 Tax=Thalictrum thalictroides TaxID=46969 RepID=A0A7J6X4P2_THATH|nr:Cyclin-dependent kinase inhibitor [Thalictrum thalictroides]
MGKYMRKAKITGEVAVMELAQSSLGVRTRAKTLALQRLQKSTSSSPTTDSSSYLQLRSRRLEKKPPSLLGTNNDSKKNQETPKESCNPNTNPSSISRTNSRLAVLGSLNSVSVGSVSLSCSKNEGGVLANNRATMVVENEESLPDNLNDVGVEASFGENVLDFEGRERSTRETTPCSLIGGSDAVGTPGSTTRPTNSSATNRRIQNAMRRNIPTTHEMEEFFAGAEQQQQRIFAEKYNFDPVNDSPLPGRYEWERVDP